VSIKSTLFLFDEQHWSYVDYKKDRVISEVLKICPYAELLFNYGGMMVFDIGRERPQSFYDIKCDYRMFSNDYNQPYPIRF
jgi:hypothetical protein